MRGVLRGYSIEGDFTEDWQRTFVAFEEDSQLLATPDFAVVDFSSEANVTFSPLLTPDVLLDSVKSPAAIERKISTNELNSDENGKYLLDEMLNLDPECEWAPIDLTALVAKLEESPAEEQDWQDRSLIRQIENDPDCYVNAMLNESEQEEQVQQTIAEDWFESVIPSLEDNADVLDADTRLAQPAFLPADERSVRLESVTAVGRPSGDGVRGTKRRRAATLDKNSAEYRQKRDRNNVFVRASREKARQRHEETERRVNELLTENKELRDKVSCLTREVEILRGLFASVGATIPKDVARILDEVGQ